MRGIVIAMLLLAWLETPASAQTPVPRKARELVEKAIQAHGGAAALEKLYTATWRGRGLIYRDERDEDKPIPFYGEWHAALPNRYRYTYALKGAGGNLPLTTAYQDGKAWRTFISGRGAEDLPEKFAREEGEEAYAHYLSRLVPLLSGDYQLTMMPLAQRDNRFILGLKVDSKGHKSCYLFFDRTKGLLTFMDRKVYDNKKQEEVMQETSYLNFKSMGGATLAQSITVRRGKKLYLELELDRVDPKDELPRSLFEKPPEPKDP